MGKNFLLDIHKPLVAHNPASAYLLSVVGNTADEYSWVMSNFVNLRFDKFLNMDDFYRVDMWYNCPFIYENSFSRQYLRDVNTDIVKFATEAIDLGYYLYLYINTRYILIYGSTSDYDHNPLIYGYDSNKRIFYLCDFFTNTGLSFGTCSFDELSDGFAHLGDIKDNPFYRYALYRLIKKKEEFIDYSFNVLDFKAKLKDYLEATNMLSSCYYPFHTNDLESFQMDHNPYDFAFGLDFYDAMDSALTSRILRHRPLHLLYCHKLLMQRRLRYLKDHNLIKNYERLQHTCDKLVDSTLILRNKYLKVLVSGKRDVFEYHDYSDALKNLKEMDKAFTQELLDDI